MKSSILSSALARLALLLAFCTLCPPLLAAARTVPDTIAQRVLACTVCHGKEGRATNAGYFPRIAGKPAGYLYNQLRNFRDGRRTNAAMTHLVDHLSDAYQREMADYFASQDLPYPPPQTANAPAAVLQQAQTLVLHGDAQRNIPACTQCHGSAMTGLLPPTPVCWACPEITWSASWALGKPASATQLPPTAWGKSPSV